MYRRSATGCKTFVRTILASAGHLYVCCRMGKGGLCGSLARPSLFDKVSLASCSRVFLAGAMQTCCRMMH